MNNKFIILISGKIDSGKNQFSDYLLDNFRTKGYTTKQDLLAKDLKDRSSIDFNPLSKSIDKLVNDVKILLGVYFDPKEHGTALYPIYNALDNIKFTSDNFHENKTDITRSLLQLYGTDIFRNRVDDKYWIKLLCDRINSYDSDVVTVTDIRFPNEIYDMYELIEGRTIISIRIDRDIDRSTIANTHISETSLDNFNQFTYKYKNNGTLQELMDYSKFIVDDLLSEPDEIPEWNSHIRLTSRML